MEGLNIQVSHRSIFSFLDFEKKSWIMRFAACDDFVNGVIINQQKASTELHSLFHFNEQYVSEEC